MYKFEIATKEHIPYLASCLQRLAKETEDMDISLENTLGGASHYADPRFGKCVVAFKNDGSDELVGGLLMGYQLDPAIGGIFYYISSIYIEKEHRGKGVLK